MRLSIFNFKPFVVKTVLFTLGMVVVYAAMIELMRPNIVFSQNQYQANMIFAQDFIYLEERPPQVIVGSSMAARMTLPNSDVYNLAFGGGGPLTGLEIIRRSGSIPKVIYIESNVFTMMADSTFMEALFPPLLFELRAKVLALQEKYQVLNIVGSFMYRVAGRSQQEKLSQDVDKELLDKLVEGALRSDDVLKVNNREELLKQWHMNMNYFLDHGTKLLFFEMPNDSRVIKTRKRQQLRELIKEKFSNVLYIEENNRDDHYKTADGTHLTWQSAIEFSKHFQETVLVK